MSPLYRRVGAYEIRAELGCGGMADVYVADDIRTGKRVALKIPRQDPEVRRAERDGALLQQHLAERDPRVASVYEIGEDDGVPFIAMEYVVGQDLSERIALGPMSPAEAIRIAIELCALLDTANACTPPHGDHTRRGIVHGDLKPRNIRIEPSGRVRVVDFGIAKALSETRRLTRNEFGSVAYASPERLTTGEVSARSDLWSVTVVLYEMLAGRPPFRADHPRQLEELILSGARLDPLPAGCPPSLAEVLSKALEPEAARRYGAAADLRQDLERVAQGQPTVAERERLSGGESPGRGLEPAVGASWPAAPGAAASGGDGQATHRSPAPGGGVDEATRRTMVTGGATDEATRRTMGTGGAMDEATRRTVAAGATLAGDGTRRTGVSNGAARQTVPESPLPLVVATHAATLGAGGSAALPPPGLPAATTGAPPREIAPGGARPRRGFLASRLRRVAVLVALALIVNEVSVLNAAGELESSLPSYARSDAPRVWSRYRSLRRRSLLGAGTWRLSGRVKDWHLSAADDLTADYLSDTPTIRERGWLQAAGLLRRASAIAPGDAGVRSRLRYVEGQLARIDAEARLERDAVAARERFNVARRAFEDAARLRRWPDPHLGLARVYTVGFADVDRTQDELRLAEQSGYTLGNREIALVADAHRMRAERTWPAIPDLPDEDIYLDRVADDCRRAIELYGEVPAYREVSGSIRRTHALLRQVQARQRELRGERTFLERIGDAARDLVTPLGQP